MKGPVLTTTVEPCADRRALAEIAGELRHVDKWYGSRHVLIDVSLQVRTGEIVALVGRSGSGKSTVLRVLAGLSDDHRGDRFVAGAPALAFQEPRLFPWRDVRTNVGYGLTRSRLPKTQVRQCADRALADVGLADRADAWPLTLSGGQAQRVSLARALVAQPQLLLLDEPFGALDALTRLTMRALLLGLWRQHGFGVLLITHDVDEAVALADRVLVLEGGRVAHTLSVDEPRRSPGNPGPHTEQHRAELLDRLGVRR
ncbi:MAG: sulfonate transport system ATP-binding protein [Mycobacterium sp.]|nr:sulfonate transport system ATP-binding protein [Mycobacterium sp.]